MSKREKTREKLAHTDREASDSSVSSANSDLLEKYTKARGNVSSVFTKKAKFPIGLDIFISITLILLVAALVVGAYFLVLRFDDAHENKEIEYVLLVEREDLGLVEKGSAVYVDDNGSAVYFGRVLSVNRNVYVSDDSDTAKEYVMVTVIASVQYREDEGYTIEGNTVAVGKALVARIGNMTFDSEIVGLTVRANESK